MEIDQFHTLVEGLDHPESVAWGLDGNYYAGGEAGQIYRIHPDGQMKQYASTGGFILGVCLDEQNNLYACDSKQAAVMRITPGGEVSVYSRGAPDRAMISPNYPAFDAQGNLFVSDSGERGAGNGCLYRVSPGGETQVFNREFSQNPNGIAFAPDGNELYVILTEAQKVVKVGVDPVSREQSSDPVDVLDMPLTVPDGLAFDEAGVLYIGCDSPNTIYRLASNGELTILANDWRRATLASPTNLCFGGINLTTLAVANFARWSIITVEVQTPGLRLHYPRL